MLYERQTHETHVKTNIREEPYKFLQLLVVIVLPILNARNTSLGGLLPPTVSE
jgi:hypothetical protein